MSQELTASPENTHTHKIEKRMGAMMNGREEARLSVRTPFPHIDLVAKMAAVSPPPPTPLNLLTGDVNSGALPPQQLLFIS